MPSLPRPKSFKKTRLPSKPSWLFFLKSAKDVIASPSAAISDVKARDGIVNVVRETRRLQLAIDTVINSPDARAEGFGQVNGPRLSLMASEVSDPLTLKPALTPMLTGPLHACPPRPN